MRSRVIIVEGGRVALIERVRDGRTFYTFPGGRVEPGESLEQAARREALEELGLLVDVGPLVAVVTMPDEVQHYFDVAVAGGVFGSGRGAELRSRPESRRGSYRPVWVPVADLARLDVRPRAVARLVSGELRVAPGEVLRVGRPG